MTELSHKEVSSRGGKATVRNKGKGFLQQNNLKAIKARLDLGQISQEAYDRAVARITAQAEGLPE